MPDVDAQWIEGASIFRLGETIDGDQAPIEVGCRFLWALLFQYHEIEITPSWLCFAFLLPVGLDYKN